MPVSGRWCSQAYLVVMVLAGLVDAQSFTQIDESPPKLVINEIMAANSSTITDPQDHFDDWIEIFNYGDSAIDLAGMYLSDELDNPTQWQFPLRRPDLTVVPPGQYLLVWADGDPLDFPGLHTDFKLSASGETVTLFDTDGQTLIDLVSFPEQRVNVSYGRYPDAENNWRVMDVPTPQSRNKEPQLEFVDTVQFSHDRGFYESPITVTLTTHTPDATILYTVDGSEPNEHVRRSPSLYFYSSPIPINKTTCLRAKAVKQGWASSDSVTHTYLFLPQVLTQPVRPPGYPIQWAGVPADYQMDPDVVRDPALRDDMQAALQTHLTISLAFDREHLFDAESGIYIHARNSGIHWERPVSMEIIDPADEMETHLNAGLRMQGGASRQTSRGKHNMRLLFKGEYGTSKLRFPLFENWPVEEFDTLNLRGGNGDSWFHPSVTQQHQAQYIRDQWARDSQTVMGRLTAGQCYVHLYLNGLYWGLYHALDRPNAAFYAKHLGGNEEDYDVLQHKNGTVDGNRDAWNAMMAIANAGLSSPERYTQIQQYLDIPNLIDYMCLNFYVGNKDWDHNNWYGGRRRELGHGFHFMMWDSERILLNVQDDVTGKNNANQPTRVHQQLTANDEYRMHFADHVFRHFYGDGLFTPARAIARWRAFGDEIHLALLAESARWGDAHRPLQPYTRDVEWQEEMNRLTKDFFPQRTEIVLAQLRQRDLYPAFQPPEIRVHKDDPTNPIVELLVSDNEGVIWYTLDGSDPRMPAAEPSSSGIFNLIPENATKHVLVPTAPVEENWRSYVAFDHSTWQEWTGSPVGVGYERSNGYGDYIGLDVTAEMFGVNSSCLLRIPFTWNENQVPLNTLSLNIRYDDGFVAYLNGTEVARRNAEETPLWNARATAGHSDSSAIHPETINLTESIPTLRRGANLLAIHGLNVSPTSSDFLLTVSLEGRSGESSIDIHPAALDYTDPIVLEENKILKTRCLRGNTWSALNERFVTKGNLHEHLRVTELMYHPSDPNTEFLELGNIGYQPINLNLIRFSQGIEYAFPSLDLPPSGCFIIVQDANAFETIYGTGLPVIGSFDGRLANGGERLRIEAPNGEILLDLQYNDRWYRKTDGQGYSLTLADPINSDTSQWNLQEAWLPSEEPGGSPGRW